MEVVQLVGDGKWSTQRPIIEPIQCDFYSLPTTAFDLLGGVHGGPLHCDPPPSCTVNLTLRRAAGVGQALTDQIAESGAEKKHHADIGSLDLRPLT